MQAWLKLDAVVARAATGKIALCRYAELGRSTVDDNYELLGPLISEYGSLIANMYCSQLHVEDKYEPWLHHMHSLRHATQLEHPGGPGYPVPMLLQATWETSTQEPLGI